MEIRDRLKGSHYGNDEAWETFCEVSKDGKLIKFAEFVYDSDAVVSRNAAWTITKAKDDVIAMLTPHQNRFIDLVLTTDNVSLRRLILNILERQTYNKEDLRSDFLDFCLDHMASFQETPGVQSLCMKIAYKLCSFYPELSEEFNRILTNMDMEYYKPAVRSVKSNILKKRIR